MHRERLQTSWAIRWARPTSGSWNPAGALGRGNGSDGMLTLNLLPLVREVLSVLPGVGQLLMQVCLPDLGTEEAPTAARRRRGGPGRNCRQTRPDHAAGGAGRKRREAVSALESLALVLPFLMLAAGGWWSLSPLRIRAGAILALGGR